MYGAIYLLWRQKMKVILEIGGRRNEIAIDCGSHENVRESVLLWGWKWERKKREGEEVRGSGSEAVDLRNENGEIGDFVDLKIRGKQPKVQVMMIRWLSGPSAISSSSLLTSK